MPRKLFHSVSLMYFFRKVLNILTERILFLRENFVLLVLHWRYYKLEESLCIGIRLSYSCMLHLWWNVEFHLIMNSFCIDRYLITRTKCHVRVTFSLITTLKYRWDELAGEYLRKRIKIKRNINVVSTTYFEVRWWTGDRWPRNATESRVEIIFGPCAWNNFFWTKNEKKKKTLWKKMYARCFISIWVPLYLM